MKRREFITSIAIFSAALIGCTPHSKPKKDSTAHERYRLRSMLSTNLIGKIDKYNSYSQRSFLSGGIKKRVEKDLREGRLLWVDNTVYSFIELRK